MFRVSRHQTSAHTRMEQHELWSSQVMTVALKGTWIYSLRIMGGTDDKGKKKKSCLKRGTEAEEKKKKKKQ